MLGTFVKDWFRYESHCVHFFFQAEDGIRDVSVTGVQTCALPIWQIWIEIRSFGRLTVNNYRLLHIPILTQDKPASVSIPSQNNMKRQTTTFSPSLPSSDEVIQLPNSRKQRAIIVPKAGHSLHPSGENKRLAPLSQQQACQLVVDTGLKILSTSLPGRESG